MKFFYLFIFVFVVSFESFAQNDVQQPSIMIFPSDNLLRKIGCLEVVEVQGVKVVKQDYQKAFIENFDLKFIINAIQERFAARGFPLENLEYEMKAIQNSIAEDNVENFDVDPKSMLLNTAKPDIYLDISYDFEEKGMVNVLAFTIDAVDAYTRKSIGSAGEPGIETTSNNVAKLLAEQVELNINNLQGLMNEHFDDLRNNGRIVTLRIAIENDAINDFRRDKCGTNLPYAKWVQQWIKKHAVKGIHKRGRNTAKSLKFKDIRIPLFDSEGFPMAASDWAYQLVEAFQSDCNVEAIDYTQSLGDAFIIITK